MQVEKKNFKKKLFTTIFSSLKLVVCKIKNLIQLDKKIF